MEEQILLLDSLRCFRKQHLARSVCSQITGIGFSEFHLNCSEHEPSNIEKSRRVAKEEIRFIEFPTLKKLWSLPLLLNVTLSHCYSIYVNVSLLQV